MSGWGGCTSGVPVDTPAGRLVGAGSGLRGRSGPDAARLVATGPSLRRRSMGALSSMVAGLVGVMVLGAPLAGQIPAPGPLASPHDGEIDRGWRIQELGGQVTTLDPHRGRVLFINAWASWCVPCIREMAELEALRRSLGDAEVDFFLVAVEHEAAVRRHLRLYPVDLPIYLELDRFPPLFGLRGIPMTWVVDRQGRIVLRQFGAADWRAPQIRRFLLDLAGGG